MNAQLLLTFLDVLETRNFNRTSERLNITQSSVSARIRQLEHELGARLFERGRGGADPTPAGRRFEAQCQSILAIWGQAIQDAAIGANYEGALRISVQHSLFRSLLVPWAKDLRFTMPSAILHFELDYSIQILRDISAGSIDLGIVYAPQYLPDLSVENIGAERYVMISTRTSRLDDVRPDEYIRAGYTLGFDKQHDALLPHLTRPPLSAGCEDLAVGLLTLFGGSVYVARFVAEAIIEDRSDIMLVKDAPPIFQPIFSVVHFRKRNVPNVQRALSLLKTKTRLADQSEMPIKDGV